MEETTYDLEKIIDFKNTVPDGEYIVKLIDVELGTYEGNSAPGYLQATFDIVEGELMNETITKRYSLNVYSTKTGGTGCKGLSDFRREAGKVGADSQLKQKFTATEFRKLYATIFGKKKLKLHKSMEKDYKNTVNEDGSPKFWPRYNIIGLAHPGQLAAVGAGTDPLADLGF
jgi:hypothetical protein